MSANIGLTTTAGATVSVIDWGRLEAGETSSVIVVRVVNSGTTTPADLAFGAMTSNWGSTGDRNSQGQECVTEKWLQVSTATAGYTAVGGDPLSAGATLALTPLSAGGTVDVSCRVVVPAGASTTGGFVIIPFVFWPG